MTDATDNFYTVTARVVVRAPTATHAEIAARVMLSDAQDAGAVYGAIVQDCEPTDPRDVAWIGGQQ